MYAQIIFFVALALFLVLLVHRFATTPKILERAGQLAISLSRKLGQFGSRFGSRMAEGAKKAKGSIPLLSDRPAVKSATGNDHQFWHEEASGEAGEVAGLSEEGDEYFRK